MIEYPEEIILSQDEQDNFTIFTQPPQKPCDNDKNYIKHVRCDGARFHVIWYDTGGAHCTEKDCVINRRSK